MTNPIATIPDNIPVAPGTNIKIPILLINGVNFSAIDMELKYDPNILELPSSTNLFNPNIKTGEITDNWQIYSNVNSELGTVKIALIPTINIIPKATGIIAELEFTVKNNLETNTTSILDLQKVALDEQEVSLNNGSIIVSNETPEPELVGTFFEAVSDHIIDANTNINFTILNQGIGTADNLKLDVYYSQDDNINPEEDTLITTKNYANLASGQIIDESLPISIPKNDLILSANTDDPVNLGKDHQSLNTDYLGIIIDGNLVTLEKGINSDDITYFPWDVNKDGKVTPTDTIFVINRLGQTVSNDNRKADLNLDNQITMEDVNEIYGRLGYSINDAVFND